ncbi:MAG TPA: hypothetical protein VE713_17000 [Pyrinomonadaceae bacterium]|nr:hypothetical protein [Pyrinomonadaceae bacterium]
MLPLNTLQSERRPRRRAAVAAARAALCAACLIGFTFTVCAEGADDTGTSSPLREKDIQRAEKVLAKLRLLDEAATANDESAYRARASQLYPGLFLAVADMRQSDVQTDLSTAVFLYEKVGRAWLSAGAAAVDCVRERPDIYLPLCLELRDGTARQLLLAKARLHTRWAGAVVKDYRGERGPETAHALSEMRAARANDRLIAARIVEALKPLEGLVNSSPTSAGYQERRTASKASAAGPDVEFADALGLAADLLAWMPRSPAFYQLSGARLAYVDGLSWSQKARQAKALVISANSFQSDPLKNLGMDAEQVTAAAEANWKSAVRHTRLAERSLSASAR